MQHSLSGEEACCLHLFFPHLGDMHVIKLEDLEGAALITARSRAVSAPCHQCGHCSARAHSRYRRRLRDGAPRRATAAASDQPAAICSRYARPSQLR